MLVTTLIACLLCNDQDASFYQSQVYANGGSVSADIVKAQSIFNVGAKSKGFWSAINWGIHFSGDFTAALVPYQATAGFAIASNSNFVAVDYSQQTGLKGDGATKSLDTGVVPATSLTLYSTHIAVYSRNSAPTSANNTHGSNGGSSQCMLIWAPWTDGKIYSDQYASSPDASQTLTGGYGLIGGTVTSSTNHQTFQNATMGTPIVCTGTLPTLTTTLFESTSSGAFYSDSILGGASVGSGLSAQNISDYATEERIYQQSAGNRAV